MARLPETPDVVAWQRDTVNGQIPRGKLAEIEPVQHDPDLDGPAVMYPPAAVAMTDLLAAARDAGHPVRVKYSYRTLAKQQEKWQNYQDGGNLAAAPGTSNHGEGLAVDLTDLSDPDVNWLRNNAARFKFDNADAPSEPWHWTYRGGYESEDDMGYEQFKKGVKAKQAGEALADDADPDFKFGYWMENRGTSLPKPAAAGPHKHKVKLPEQTITTTDPT